MGFLTAQPRSCTNVGFPYDKYSDYHTVGSSHVLLYPTNAIYPSKNWYRPPTRLLTIGPINGNSSSIKTSIIIKPADSIWYMNRCTGSGANAYSKRDPSKGGNGIILKTKNARLIWINIDSTLKTSVPTPMPPIRTISAAIIARPKLVKGPAIPTNAAPNSSYFTRAGLNGTGLAIKNGGIRSRISIIGSKTVVNASMCLRGFNVSRPSSCAVVSPSACAVKACIAS